MGLLAFGKMREDERVTGRKPPHLSAQVIAARRAHRAGGADVRGLAEPAARPHARPARARSGEAAPEQRQGGHVDGHHLALDAREAITGAQLDPRPLCGEPDALSIEVSGAYNRIIVGLDFVAD